MLIHLVIIVKVNPTTQSLDGVSPFLGVAHNNRATLFVVLGNAELHHGSFPRDSKFLVNLVFDGKTMSIPTKAAFDVKALHGPVSRNDILDGGGKKMPIVRKSSRERRPVVESVVRTAFRQFYL